VSDNTNDIKALLDYLHGSLSADLRWAKAIRKIVAERDALAAEVAALKAKHGPQTDAQVQEQVAAIVHAAMRFAREDVTPEWQAGNSHAEYRARQAATEIASMLRCALKAHDPLAEMWRELESYQPQADKDGHGESWAKMCSERTGDWAWEAKLEARKAWQDAAWAAADAVARALADATEWAVEVIEAIRRAKEAKP
jgi:chorismate mutase